MKWSAKDLAGIARDYETELGLSTVRENQVIFSARVDLAWAANRRANDEDRANASVPRISLRSAS